MYAIIEHMGRILRPVLLPVVLVLGVLFLGANGVAEAADLNPDVANGRTVLYVYNRIKLEAAEKVTPVDPKRIEALTTWRRNDTKAMAYLTSLGFQVRQADEAASPDTLKGIDLIIVSESVDAINIGTKYKDVAIPLITFENDILGELDMTGYKNGKDYGTDDDQRFLWLVNAPHPLAAGLSAGFQNVLTDEHYKMNWGRPCLGAITIATLRGEPDKAAIFAYEKGATMNGEFLAPARRLSFFLWQDTFEAMRPEGLALFRAAVLWTVSRPGSN